MAVLREAIARALVVLALVVLALALGTWWASLLSIRTAGTLNGLARVNLVSEVSGQLDKLSPGASRLPGVQADIEQVLKSPEVTQALARSVPEGSHLLVADLSRSDPALASLLSGKFLSVSAGQHALARTADRLRSIARLALIVALGAATAALALSPLRHLVLRHLAYGVVVIGGLVLLGSAALPALVGRLTHGGVHHWAESVLSGGDLVRTVVLECFIAGAVLAALTFVFELRPAKAVRYDAAAGPVPPGRSV
jgi:hypothetical protein